MNKTSIVLIPDQLFDKLRTYALASFQPFKELSFREKPKNIKKLSFGNTQQGGKRVSPEIIKSVFTQDHLVVVN